MENKESFLEKSISKSLNFIYSDNKVQRYLVLLIVLGFIFRIIAALNLDALPDDMIKASQAAGITNAKILSTSSAPALYYYLTDYTYRVIGYTTLASRFWNIIFGALLIPLTFLITKKFFNEKIALLSAFFVAFSTFLVRMTISEESLMVLFFCFCGVYFGMEYLDNRNNWSLMLGSIFFGLASLTKYSTPFFLFSFLVFSLFYLNYRKEKIFSKQNIKALIFVCFIFVIFSLPFLTFNYLIYKDKGILDVYFSRLLPNEKSDQLYSSLAGQDVSFFDSLVDSTSYDRWDLFFKSDQLLFFFGFLGIILLFIRKNKMPLYFIFTFFILLFFFQSVASNLQKHFVFMMFLFAIPAGFGCYEILKKLKGTKKNKITAIFILSLLMVLSFGMNAGTPQSYFTKSATSQLKSYVNEEVKQSELVVLDPRIYTSKSFWIAIPNHMLNLFQFIEFYNQNLEISDQNKVFTNIYFIECAIDDCGWGTIKNQPDLNRSVENIFDQIANSSASSYTIITAKNYYGNELFGKTENIPVYKIYKQQLALNPLAIARTDEINAFYFTPYLYINLEEFVYHYTLHSTQDRLLNKFAYFIIILSVILSIISVFLIIYFSIIKKE